MNFTNKKNTESHLPGLIYPFADNGRITSCAFLKSDKCPGYGGARAVPFNK